MKSFKNKKLLNECVKYVKNSYLERLKISIQSNSFKINELKLLLSFLPYEFYKIVIKEEGFVL